MKRPEDPPTVLAAPRALARSRGFTLIELSIVIIIIGVFSALAMPNIYKQMSDRRTRETALRIALIFQQARTRAMGQGGAILVRYGAGANGQGSFQTIEALVGTGDAKNACALVPSSSCNNTNWAAGDSTNRVIETVDLSTQYGLGDSTTATQVYAALTVPGNAAAGPTMDVCFTPLGRTFMRLDPTIPGFLPLTVVPSFDVFRSTSVTGQSSAIGLVRNVLILPTGISRLRL